MEKFSEIVADTVLHGEMTKSKVEEYAKIWSVRKEVPHDVSALSQEVIEHLRLLDRPTVKDKCNVFCLNKKGSAYFNSPA